MKELCLLKQLPVSVVFSAVSAFLCVDYTDFSGQRESVAHVGLPGLTMPSFFIRVLRVLGLIPRIAAAP